METRCVFFGVRTDFLNIQTSFGFRGLRETQFNTVQWKIEDDERKTSSFSTENKE
jgi:hypothetical protein